MKLNTKRKELLLRMTQDWNARIANDYMGWMNEPVYSEQELWSSGERDFVQIRKSLEKSNLSNCNALELGCGVGRLLKPASKVFREVIGVDVSDEAIKKARELLKDYPNIRLLHSCGDKLSGIADSSIDVIYSFGVIISLPVSIWASYLLEVKRVLAPYGKAALQVFLGKGQASLMEDTVAYRSYPYECFFEAVAAAGLNVVHLHELDIGAVIPDDEWLKPYICCVQANSTAPCQSIEEIEAILLPGGEETISDTWPGSLTEYQLSVIRGLELLQCGNEKLALQVLSFAVNRYEDPDPDVVDIVNQLTGDKQKL